MLDEHRIDLAARAHRARERAAVGVRDRRFAGRIDLGQHEHVGFGEHVREVVEQIARARVAMRLERDDEPLLRPAVARGREHGRELARMMTVVVDEHRAAVVERDVAADLEAPADAFELLERALHRLGLARRAASRPRTPRAR